MAEHNDEITLRELFFKIRQWWKYLLSKWIIIMIAAILGGIIGLLYAINKKPTYTGTLTFVLSNNSSSGGGLVSLAGQFGLDIGGSNNNGAFEGENIIELLKSKRIIKGALFRIVPDEKKALINMIGEEFELFGQWEKSPQLAKQIPFPSEVSKVTPIQDSLIRVIQEALLKNNLNIDKQDKKLSFYQISTTSPKENISIWLTRYLVDEAADMYINTKTKVARENLNMLQHEADSLRGRLSGTIYSSASTIDATFNLNPALQSQRAPIQQNQFQAQVLGAAYGEVIKNLEMAKITLQKETPLFQIIDEPQSPLTKIKTSKRKAILLGIVCFIFLSSCLLIFQRIMKSFSAKQ